ncbi:ABC transporter ATP-binding protein [Thermoflexus sp.]|uniref:ABC transporter ATP-binding protein n=1 Tax=Thermoflexus sp. TaxID=1969742 RepID=UPI00176220DC|nr:ABC transporter ATP-binding protein [Thermoflexus sp.]
MYGETLLETRGLTKNFGGLRAVDQVDLRVEAGTIHALIGPNGAGKSTLFNLIGGSLRPTAGRIFYRGKDITDFPPHHRAHLGIGRAYQLIHVFPNLSVLENVRLAAQAQGPDNFRFWVPAARLHRYLDRAWAVLHEIGMAELADLPARALSHGHRRWLEIAMVLAQEPQLMLLDEPAAGMAIEQIPRLIRLIEEIHQRGGRTILLIEHKIDLVMRLAHRVTVLHHGHVLAEGTPEEIARNEAVQRAYLGERSWMPSSN